MSNLQEIAIREFLEMFDFRQFHKELVKMYLLQDFNQVNKNNRIYSYEDICNSFINRQQEQIQNEYRKFIEENRYGRIKYRRGEVSVPRIQCSKSNGNNIKYDSRRLLDDMGK